MTANKASSGTRSNYQEFFTIKPKIEYRLGQDHDGLKTWRTCANGILHEDWVNNNTRPNARGIVSECIHRRRVSHQYMMGAYEVVFPGSALFVTFTLLDELVPDRNGQSLLSVTRYGR